MNNGVVGAIAFTLGAAAGSIVTWLLVKKKYEKQAQDDAQEIREYYAEKYKDKKPAELKNEQIRDSSDECEDDYDSDTADIQRIDYANIIKNEGYTNEKKGVGTIEDGPAPYVIAPEEYGETKDYEMVSLTHYSDGVLADDWDEVIEDVANTVGANYADHFGEYEDDSVFIRNERLKVDYEILLDMRPFEEVKHAGPRPDNNE